jgi:histone-lysine N-methyltransferase SETMAR
MDSDKFIETVLKPLQEDLLKAEPPPARPWFIYYDNARPHISEKTQTFLDTTYFIHLQAPPYSPDFSPPDFFLFGPLKAHLEAKVFKTQDDLEMSVLEFLEGLSQTKLTNVFNNWIERCEQVSETGQYYKK